MPPMTELHTSPPPVPPRPPVPARPPVATPPPPLPEPTPPLPGTPPLAPGVPPVPSTSTGGGMHPTNAAVMIAAHAITTDQTAETTGGGVVRAALTYVSPLIRAG